MEFTLQYAQQQQQQHHQQQQTQPIHWLRSSTSHAGPSPSSSSSLSTRTTTPPVISEGPSSSSRHSATPTPRGVADHRSTAAGDERGHGPHVHSHTYNLRDSHHPKPQQVEQDGSSASNATPRLAPPFTQLDDGTGTGSQNTTTTSRSQTDGSGGGGSLFDVPPGYRTMVSTSRSPLAASPVSTASPSRDHGAASNSRGQQEEGATGVDRLARDSPGEQSRQSRTGPTPNRPTRLTRLQRKSLLNNQIHETEFEVEDGDGSDGIQTEHHHEHHHFAVHPAASSLQEAAFDQHPANHDAQHHPFQYAHPHWQAQGHHPQQPHGSGSSHPLYSSGLYQSHQNQQYAVSPPATATQRSTWQNLGQVQAHVADTHPYLLRQPLSSSSSSLSLSRSNNVSSSSLVSTGTPGQNSGSATHDYFGIMPRRSMTGPVPHSRHSSVSASSSSLNASGSSGLTGPSAAAAAAANSNAYTFLRMHSNSVSSSASSSAGTGELSPGLPGLNGLPMGSTGRRVNRLSNLDRKELCEYAAANPRMKHDLLGKIFDVERSTVSKILKNKAKWLAVKPDNTLGTPVLEPDPAGSSKEESADNGAHPASDLDNKAGNSVNSISATPSGGKNAAKVRVGRHPELEQAIIEWGRQETRNNRLLSDDSVRTKALEIAESMHVPLSAFKASAGWLENFKVRAGYRAGRFSLGMHAEQQDESQADETMSGNNADYLGDDTQGAQQDIGQDAVMADHSEPSSPTPGTWAPDSQDSSFSQLGSGWISPLDMPQRRQEERLPTSLSSSVASLGALTDDSGPPTSSTSSSLAMSHLQSSAFQRDFQQQQQQEIMRTHSRMSSGNTGSSQPYGDFASGRRLHRSHSALSMSQLKRAQSFSSDTALQPSSSSSNPLQSTAGNPSVANFQPHMTTPTQKTVYTRQQQDNLHQHPALAQGQDAMEQTAMSRSDPSSTTSDLSSPYGHSPGFASHRVQQAGINFNLSLNSTPLQTISARQPLDLTSPVETRTPSRGHPGYIRGLGLHSAAVPSNQDQHDPSQPGAQGRSPASRASYSLRSRMNSAPGFSPHGPSTGSHRSPPLSAGGNRPRQAPYPDPEFPSSSHGGHFSEQQKQQQHSLSVTIDANLAGGLLQSQTSSPLSAGSYSSPTKAPLLRSHTAPSTLPESASFGDSINRAQDQSRAADSQPYDASGTAAGPQQHSQALQGASSGFESFASAGRLNSARPSVDGNQQMSDFSGYSQPRNSGTTSSEAPADFHQMHSDPQVQQPVMQQTHQQHAPRRATISSVPEASASYIYGHNYPASNAGSSSGTGASIASFAGNVVGVYPPFPISASPSFSASLQSQGSFGSSPSQAWADRVTFDEAFVAARKLVGFFGDSKNAVHGLTPPQDTLYVLQTLLGQFRQAYASKPQNLTPPSST